MIPPMMDDEPRYSLSELTDEAGVSVRTVRYYVAEGLLPPPVTAGPRSFYTRAHLDRLRLIDRLKTSYLPLKEIRRRLTALDDEEVRRLVAVETPASPPAARVAAPRMIREPAAGPPDSAASYIARLMHRPAPAAAAASPAAPLRAELQTDDHEVARMTAPVEEVPDMVADFLAEPMMAAPVPEEVGATSWRRIPVGEDAELLVREEAYQRKRDRVEWLVGWARKVFG
jgi:DNA-binding transcriptional MerR regulator